MLHLIAFAARMASANDCAPLDKLESLPATPDQLTELDNWLATLTEDQLETLADGNEEDITPLENTGPACTHEVLEEVFMQICG